MTAPCLTTHLAVGNGIASTNCEGDVAECTTAIVAIQGGCMNAAADDADYEAGGDGYVDTCPSTCQADVDTIYSACEACTNWETLKPSMKTLAAAMGCGGAAHAAPALFVAVFAVLGQFLS